MVILEMVDVKKHGVYHIRCHSSIFLSDFRFCTECVTESLTLVWYPKRGDWNLINRISANYDHEHLVDVVIFVIPARLKCCGWWLF